MELPDVDKNGLKWLEIAGMAINDWIQLEIVGTG